MSANSETCANDQQSNSLGIPRAEFVEDVDKFMEKQNNANSENTATAVIRKLDENHSKYRFMELNLLQKKKRLKKQIPDIKGSLEVLNLIKNRKASDSVIDTQFLLSDQVYMSATIEPTSHICLWLGVNKYTAVEALTFEHSDLNSSVWAFYSCHTINASSREANVMLEYTIEEAEQLLSKNLETATKNLDQIDIDLDFLRDQITTTEVNMARVYNWDVKRRQSDKNAAK